RLRGSIGLSVKWDTVRRQRVFSGSMVDGALWSRRLVRRNGAPMPFGISILWMETGQKPTLLRRLTNIWDRFKTGDVLKPERRSILKNCVLEFRRPARAVSMPI